MNRSETETVAANPTLARIETSPWLALHRRVASGEPGFALALLRAALAPVALAYAAIAAARNRLYDLGVLRAHRVAVRVVSVGNLTAGGTGKTPVVLALAKAALAAGKRPAILMRGYRRHASSDSDEARLLERALPAVPVVVGPDRVRSAAIAIAHGADLLFLDDGFQHRRLARDVDVVLLDARDPWGGGWQLPRGFLREPPSGLARAHVVVLTRVDRAGGTDAAARLVARVRREAPPDVPILLERHRAAALVDRDFAFVAPAAAVRGERVFAFSGIGDPTTLVETLSSLGARVVGASSFPDHHEFTAADLARLAALSSASGVDRVVTTEKDLARLSGRELPFAVVALQIAAEFEVDDSFREASRRLGFPWPSPGAT